MKFLSGYSDEPFLMMQGGAGPMDPSREGIQAATAALQRIASDALQARIEGLDLATRILMGLEDDPLFNAGFGSALQADGKPRLSASLMDGGRQRFSAVISMTDVRHPSRIARYLQEKNSRVMTAPGHELIARKLGLPVEDLVTPKRLERWLRKREESGFDCDTVGVVIFPLMAAGTSTGGRGYEFPGRVTDSATVAGNYASPFAAISATGIGEQIVDDALCARLETRVRDGMTLEAASKKCYDEALARGHSYGWVAADKSGFWVVAYTSEHMNYWVQTLSGARLVSS